MRDKGRSKEAKTTDPDSGIMSNANSGYLQGFIGQAIPTEDIHQEAQRRCTSEMRICVGSGSRKPGARIYREIQQFRAPIAYRVR